MERFMTYDFNVSKIDLCARVTKGSPIHTNRASHGVVFYPEGSSTFSFSTGKNVVAAVNSLIYLPQGSNYTVSSSASHVCYAINFRLDDDFCDEPFCVQLKNPSLFYELFKGADKYFTQRQHGYMQKCKAYLYDILFALQHEYSLGYISGNKKATIQKAVDLIHETYMDTPPTVAQLSDLCGMTPEYFRRLFSQIFGTSPLKYINKLKNDRAKELLSSGMYSVYEVAHMSGFEDVGYFSRSFRKMTGVSPSDYMSK